MSVPRQCQIFTAIFLLSIAAFAQNETGSETKQSRFKVQLIQTSYEAASLKLPENRALVYAKLGKIYWRTDESRARQLFQQSIEELIKAQNDAELNVKNASRQTDLLIYGQTRQKILEFIAYLDADLAFKFLIKSRSATVRDAFAGISNEPPQNTYNYQPSNEIIVQQENTMEQRLISVVADQNPERAVAILSDARRRNTFLPTFELLVKIHQKDPKTAEAILNETIQKLLAADFNKNSPELQLTNYFLMSSTREDFIGNWLKNVPETLRKLAEKMTDFLLREANRNAEYSASDLTPTLAKILPERAAELKEKTVPRRRSFFDIFPQNKEARELLQSNAAPEKLLSEADKFPPTFREEIYVSAANKIALAGDVARAQEILIKNFPVQRRAELFAGLNWQLAYRAMGNGKFDEAAAFVELLPETLRFEALINLAGSILAKSPQDRQKAISILGKARSLTPDAPSNLSEINRTGQLAAAYASVEPETGFWLFEQAIKKIAEVSEADVIVKNFRADSNVQQNEFVINSGLLFSGFSEIQGSLDKLTSIDFEKTIEIINKIPRRDVRIALQLEVLENGWELNYR